MKFLNLVFPLVLLSACTIQKEEKNQMTGKIYMTFEENWITNQRDGETVYYYENGNVQNKLTFNNGKLDGECLSYYKNGKLEFKVQYKKDLLWNVLEYYDMNGEELDYGTFKNGDGHLKRYFDDGRLREEGSMKNGLREGVWKFYSRGSFFYERLYEEGKAQDINNNNRVSRVF